MIDESSERLIYHAVWQLRVSQQPEVVCDGWIEPRHARTILKLGDPSQVSHGMCKDCEQQMMKTL